MKSFAVVKRMVVVLVDVMLLLIGTFSLTVFSWNKAILKLSARGSSINIFEINGKEQLMHLPGKAATVNDAVGSIEGNREDGTIVGKGNRKIGIEVGETVDC
jgi:hypothetical protein